MKAKQIAAATVLLLCLGAALWGVPRFIAALPTSAAKEASPLLESLAHNRPLLTGTALVLMVVEAFIPAVPFAAIVAFNALLFGPLGGWIISWSGGMIGAAGAFYVARILGRERIARFLRSRNLDRYEAMLDEHSFVILLISRFIPGINAVLSYVAGLSPASFGTFMLSTAVALIPWVTLFVFFSQSVITLHWHASLAGFAVLGTVIYWFLVLRRRRARHA